MSNEHEGSRTRQEIEAALVARAWADPEFKRLLMTDPREAVRQETGILIPEVFQITVMEETPTHGYLVVHVNQLDLADEQLEGVAAGLPVTSTACACS